MRSAILLLLLSLTTACAIGRTSVNRPLEPGLLRLLEPGKTTAREAVELLGAPVDVVQLGRRSAYRYQFTSAKSTALILIVVNLYNQDSRTDRAWLFFDENEVLTHLGVSLEGAETEYAMPWEDVHD